MAISPKDQAEFGGEDTEIYIQWSGTLQEGQQYAVTVRYVGHGDETKVVGTGSDLASNQPKFSKSFTGSKLEI